ncbi:F-box/FBD/LRR-repeat protein At1g13570-like [Chenopodium quinoa]|nr:F-box/FBD/LRR-repeat protein At1g13570-like [Chenopodium quinoa]XP_021755117.1 F-box/FBD/LRR-repeat protein At1g13570-like [Chenopodium quinoa]XP_021755124.1 F-box/FBD/LRR-repeat protein At1g13570-like [Chenopodium quinoa]
MEDTNHLLGLGEQNMSEENVDRISSLPWEVLDIILGKLSLKDAARTCVLASEWRYKWLSLSKFVLDADYLPTVFSMTYLRWDKVANIVNRYLLNHDGAIKTFVLKTNCRAHYPDLYQWILYLSRQDVEIMSLEERDYNMSVVPSYLFLFDKLQSLNLQMCALKIPSSFRRFSFLHELSLRNVSISDYDLHHLILACPLLEKLVVLEISVSMHLKFYSPRLLELQIDIGMEDIVIGDPAHLDSVCILDNPVRRGMNYNWRSVIRCFSRLVVLQNLVLCGAFIEILAADSAFENFPLRNNTLSFLSLSDVNCENIGVFRVCLSLLRSCPNIKKFEFVIDEAKGLRQITQFLKQNKGVVSFPALDSIAVTCPYETGMGCTVNFIEFLCAHSPNLRSLSIAGWPDMKKSQVSRMLKRFKNVCPRAEVIYTCK